MASTVQSSEEDLPSRPFVHRVSAPHKQNLFKEFKSTVKETLFADDPLRSFKDQSKLKKLVLGIQAIFPIFDWSRSYSFTKFRGDLISGLTIASLCIPQKYIDDVLAEKSPPPESAANPVANWRISAPGDHPQDVKARLKYWAQVMACTVKLCS